MADLDECMGKCKDDETCKCFTFNANRGPDIKRCNLSKDPEICTGGDELKDNDQVDYYEPTGKSINSLIICNLGDYVLLEQSVECPRSVMPSLTVMKALD